MSADYRDWSDFNENTEARMFFLEHVLPDLGIDPDDDEAVLRAFTKFMNDQADEG